MKFSDCFDLYGESVSSIGTTKHSYIQEKPIVRKDSYCHLSKISNISIQDNKVLDAYDNAKYVNNTISYILMFIFGILTFIGFCYPVFFLFGLLIPIISIIKYVIDIALNERQGIYRHIMNADKNTKH